MKIAHEVLRPFLTAAIGATLLAGSQAFAQTFTSGSTGSDGALAPAANTVVTLPPDGVLNYTTVTVPAGVTVTFQRNAANTPVTLLATGDVTINGTLSVNGSPGTNGDGNSIAIAEGGLGGPGGFKGGNGAVFPGIAHTAGQGPGGGVTGQSTGTYGAPSTFQSLIPLFGGSGGAGSNSGGGATGGGGGGGGAILIASSSKIVVAGAITANGGEGGQVNGSGGRGSGGAVRLVAPQITGAGSIQATNLQNQHGRIRLEAFALNFTGTFVPSVGSGTSFAGAPGPVTAASNPALVALPTLAITSVGGVAAPGTSGGSYFQADVSLAQGTTNPVPVVVTATNTPTSAALTVALMPVSGSRSTASAALSGSFASSTATANVTFPAGAVSVVQAWATMTLTGQIASLFPLIDGEPVEQVAVASPLESDKSTLLLITRSGKRKRADQLDPDERTKLAQAWQLMRLTQ